MSAPEPWSKWFWTDYETDPGLRMSSLAAQGLWMRMLCLMAKATPKGDLRVGGEPCTVADLAVYAGQPEEAVAALVEELERRGVFSRTRAGVIYNRRLRNDAIISRKRAEAGAKGASVTNGKGKGKIGLPRQNPGKPPGKSPAPEARSQIDSVPNGTADKPPGDAERLWSVGLAVLTGCAVPERQARSLLGKWRKVLGDGETLAKLAHCQANSIADPVAFIEASLSGATPKSRFESEDQRMQREREEFLAREYPVRKVG